MKIAVVTPYHKEPLWKLQRCHQSVLEQSESCTHILVADGHPRPEVDSWNCLHIVLPAEHGDNGNTPRGIGSLCAMNEKYDCILYLDADNWYAPEHALSILYTQSLTGSPVVFSFRHIVFPDGEIIETSDPEDIAKTHVDTSCMAIFWPAYRSLAAWCQMPQELGPRCDRVMFSLLVSEFQCSWTEHKSVFFETWYWGHFILAKRAVPKDAKFLDPIDLQTIDRLNSQYSLRSYRPCMIQHSPYELPASTRRHISGLALLFIMGPPRCGTTVLQRHLSRPGLALSFPEHQFFHWFKAFYGSNIHRRILGSQILNDFQSIGGKNAKTAWWKEHVVDLTHILEPSLSYTAKDAYEMIISHYRAEAEDGDFKVILDKTLSNSGCADFILSCFPDSQIILSIRHPIDALSAIRKISIDQPSTWKEPRRALPQLIISYINSLLIPLRASSPSRIITVRHESYLKDPSGTEKAINDFIGLDARTTDEAKTDQHRCRIIREDESWKLESVEQDLWMKPRIYAVGNYLSIPETRLLVYLLQPLISILGYDQDDRTAAFMIPRGHAKLSSCMAHNECEMPEWAALEIDQLCGELVSRLKYHSATLPHQFI